MVLVSPIIVAAAVSTTAAVASVVIGIVVRPVLIGSSGCSHHIGRAAVFIAILL